MGDCEYIEDKETLTTDNFSLNIGPINIKTDLSSKTCDTEKCNISNTLISDNIIHIKIDNEYIKFKINDNFNTLGYIRFGGSKYILTSDSIKLYSLS